MKIISVILTTLTSAVIATNCGKNQIYREIYCDTSCEVDVECQSQKISTGCYCRDGFERDWNGECVNESLCCNDPNEEHLVEGLENTCDDINKTNTKAAGCFCKSGYVRMEGKCMPINKCPTKCKGLNEIYHEIDCACDPDYTCDNVTYIDTIVYPKCRCAKGFVRDKYGKCIPKEECPPLCTGPHEIPKETGCDYTCDGLEHSTFQGRGCYCKPGYVRNRNGTCILKEECPPLCTGPHEIPKETGCDYTCDGLEHRTFQGRGCYCKPGYVRNRNGTCILKEECPPLCTGPHEIPKETGCDYTCDGIEYNTFLGRGCYCKPGYVRNRNGTCILKEECPPLCTGPHEIPKETGCDYTCDGLEHSTFQGRGCYCKPGYVRNRNGTCILKEECPPLCTGPHEISKETGCDYTCDGLEHSTFQGRGCYCKPGYVRNRNGTCILKEECPPLCTGPHEIPKETGCDYTCDGLEHSTFQGRGCYCKPGYVRNRNGTCILKEECPSLCTGPHEIPKETGCDYTCDGLEHSTFHGRGCYCKSGYVRNRNGTCILKEECPPLCTGPHEIPKETGCDYTCDGLEHSTFQGRGCYCKPGYVRNRNGTCILKEECPPLCTGPHEIPKETGCDYTCDGLEHSTFQGRGCYCKPGYVRNRNGTCILKEECPPLCTGPHEIPKETGCDYTCDGHEHSTFQGRGCYCKPGYVRNRNGTCILKEECPPLCTGPHEIPKETGSDYTCDGLEHSTFHGRGCYCKPGYVRNRNGTCILKEECPPLCTGPHEIPKETGCDYTCDGLEHSTFQGRGCYCKPGYVRNRNGTCILKEECPPLCTGPHEIPKETGCDYTCDGLEYSTFQGRGCYCKPGYVRNRNGTCILKEECPPLCTGPHEIPKETGCDYTCDGLEYSTFQGRGCYCKPGYVRNRNGTCILKEECPPLCTGPHEIPKESGCDYTCDGLEHSTLHGRCCYCKPGYVRNRNGTCILKEECPPLCTGPHEIPKEAGCDYTCDGLEHSTFQGRGCYCKPGYVRNRNGTCILKEECPPLCTGPHEIPKETGCDYTCDGLEHSTFQGRGCYCKPGYVRNRNGTCILKEECPPLCTGPHEIPKEAGCDYTCDGLEYSTFQGRGCYCKPGYVRNRNGTCILKEECPPLCTGPHEIPKETGCDYTCDGLEYSTFQGRGCYCKPGYVRNRNGTCILKEECPPLCTGPHEIPKETGCDYTCDGLEHSTFQGRGCYCKPGYVRNRNGTCILKEECPPLCTGPHEIPKETGCDYTCDGLEHSTFQGRGCYCKPGYVRNRNGTCILKEECPPLCTGPHEIPKEAGCDYTCDGLEHSTFHGRGCYCKPGYVRNRNGTCILKEECPPLCTGPHEIPKETGCDYTCDGLEHSSFHGRGCYCKPGYVRNRNGTCILKEECPPLCTGPHEIPKETGFDYTCDGLEHTTFQGRGCYCKPGYVRNKNGICILKANCPPLCQGPNEIHKEIGCDFTCGGVTCNSTHGKHCYCKPGYVRNKNGICILKANCPPLCQGPNEIHKEIGCDFSCGGVTCNSTHGKHCYCKPGYVRNKNGICILKTNCPPLCQGPNEIHKEIGCDFSCGGVTCNSTHGKHCYCKPGYVRNKNGICILKANCPPLCQGPNEIHKEIGCDFSCGGVTCNSTHGKHCYCKPGYVRNKNGICILKTNCPPLCQGPNEIHKEIGCDFTCGGVTCNSTHGKHCYCKPGYVRNKNGICILKANCPPLCQGPNEIHKEIGCDFSCGGVTCNSTHGKHCYCKPGYVRNKNGICILKTNCPPLCQGPNEIHKEIGCDFTCGGVTCNSTHGKHCYCKPGYVRNKNGICILKANCPPLCQGPNEIHKEIGCDFSCGGVTCNSTHGKHCYCKPGYVRNKNGICILKTNCPPLCQGPNEIHKEIGCDFTCGSVTCNSTHGKHCYCKPGYVRNKNRICILKANCPPLCQGPNEIHKEIGCDFSCGGVTCNSTHGKHCYCKPGYVRNKNGICILKANCPPLCQGPNEIHKATGCDSTCAGVKCNSSHRKRCYCKPGYVRNKNGICILKANCPPLCQGPNEIHKATGCDSTCGAVKCNSTHGKRCYCKPGYVRNKNGICILKGKCLPQCKGPNEIYKETGCDSSCGGVKCNSNQGKGCYCKANNLRNKHGKCIPKSECPSKCNGPNEVQKQIGFDYTCGGITCVTSYGDGCFCELGYVRNKDGECIPKSQCPFGFKFR